MRSILFAAKKVNEFSFASIAVSRAGIRLHQALATSEITFPELATTFTVDRFIPSVKTMQKFWTSAELEEDYGGTEGIYFRREIQEIQESVDTMPPYRQGSSTYRHRRRQYGGHDTTRRAKRFFAGLLPGQSAYPLALANRSTA